MSALIHRLVGYFREGEKSPAHSDEQNPNPVVEDLSFGPLSVRLTYMDNDPVGPLLKEEFSTKSHGTTPDVTLNLNPEHSDDPGRCIGLAGNLKVFENCFTVTEAKFSYTVANAFASEAMTIDLRYVLGTVRRHRKTSAFQREMAFRFFKDGISSYGCLWHLFALALLKKDCAFIHAGVVNMSGTALLFCGVGGSGKTSLTTKYLDQPDATYLAEDFGIVSATGETYFSPKAATIYGSDVKYGQADLVRYVDTLMSTDDRAQWKQTIENGKNPRRKISPRTLFPDKCGDGAHPVRKAYFILRQEREHPHVEIAGSGQFEHRALFASMRELKRLTEILQQCAAVVEPGLYPTPADFEAGMARIYADAFRNAERFVVRAPLGATPQQLFDGID